MAGNGAGVPELSPHEASRGQGGLEGTPLCLVWGAVKLFGESGGFQSTREMILQCSLALVQPAALALGFFDIACSPGV